MKLVLVTVGTRGDVQPFIVLGRALAARGFDITIATHADYEAWVKASSFGFRPIGGSFKALMESPEGREWIESADSLRKYTETTKRVFVPLLEKWAEDMLAAVEDADAAVLHPYAVCAHYLMEKRGRPSVVVPFFQHSPVSGEGDPLFWPTAPEWGFLRRWLGELTMRSIWALAMDLHQTVRARLELPAFRTKNPWNELLGPHFPIVHIYSEVLSPRPRDWPEWAHVTGFIFDDAPPSYEPPAELAAFLDAGPPPLYIGFGSMTGKDPALLARMAVDAVTRTKQRALLASGWGAMARDAVDLPSSIFPIEDVPHAWLFPRVLAVVHHGGAGTTAAGLRAARPTLVTAFFGDQPYFGTRVWRIGAGPRPILKKQLTADTLARGIEDLLGTESYATRSAEIAERLATEDGAGTAADRIAAHVSRQV
jgi:sterol 3beta-glucosyltransferase